jgi:hypothetical protein
LVTDHAIDSLIGIKRLETLNLGYTKLTDAGLKKLAGLKDLKALYLYDTDVTRAGIEQLQKALPKCEITR